MRDFEVFTDPVGMQAVLQQRLPGFGQNGLRIADCRVARVRHFEKRADKPVLRVCYWLNVVDTPSTARGLQILYANIYPESCSRAAFEKVSKRPLSTPPFGTGLVHLPELEMIVWSFPNDAKLPHLPDVTDANRVKYFLPYESLPKGIDGPGDLIKASIEVMRYQPENRCTTCYRLQWGSRTKPNVIRLFGKTFKGKGNDNSAELQQLWKWSQGVTDAFGMPEPLGYNDTVKTLWLAAVPGQPFTDVIDSNNHHTLTKSIAKGLASLHKATLSISITKDIRDHLKQAKKYTRRLINNLPACRTTLQSMVQTLENRLPCLPPVPTTPIHGAFRLPQLLVSNNKVFLLDFDDLAIGDPVADLASLFVDLHGRGFESDLVSAMTTDLYHAYTKDVEWEVPTDRLDWHMQTQAIKRASWLCVHKTPGYRDRALQYIRMGREKGLILDGLR